nr:hypothetical protein [Micromonospora sp. RTGN7]
MSTDDEARPAARLTVLAGPSGAGVGSVVEPFRARSPSVWTPVPATTRPRRLGEVDGVDRTGRAVHELVGLLGSSFMAPSQPRLRG